MKYFGIILVALAALLIPENEASPSLKALRLLEKNLRQTTESLVNYKANLDAEGRKKFDALLNKEKQMISKAINHILDGISGNVEEINETMKHNHEKCKEVARIELGRAEDRVLPKLEFCCTRNMPNWHHIEAEIDVLLNKGKELKKRLHDIEKNCATDATDEKLHDACIAKRLPAASVALGVHHTAIATMKSQVVAATLVGFKDVGVCSAVPLAAFKIRIAVIRRAAHKCVSSGQDESMLEMDM